MPTIKNLEKLEQQSKKLKEELAQLKQHAKNLEAILNKITSAKAFKLWQEYNRVLKFFKLKR